MNNLRQVHIDESLCGGTCTLVCCRRQGRVDAAGVRWRGSMLQAGSHALSYLYGPLTFAVTSLYVPPALIHGTRTCALFTHSSTVMWNAPLKQEDAHMVRWMAKRREWPTIPRATRWGRSSDGITDHHRREKLRCSRAAGSPLAAQQHSYPPPRHRLCAASASSSLSSPSDIVS